MNLYIHFPFCRRKCAYCALPSRSGASVSARAHYVEGLVAAIGDVTTDEQLETVYFGGGSPAYCDLKPVFAALDARFPARRKNPPEFTVELHPHDVTDRLLADLRDGGVNRISMGVQSLDDKTLARMGRGYACADAARAFASVKSVFDNAGIDLIVGFPGDPCAHPEQLADWGLRHCSVYSLQNERHLANVPDDDWVLDRLRGVADCLATFGLARYEISNFAVPGFECRHNLAVWCGEDYVGLGEAACGRQGLVRTRGCAGFRTETHTVEADFDRKERCLFRLRTRKGLLAADFPEWTPSLKRFESEGLLVRTSSGAWRLTLRGTEVCDVILAELV